MSNTFQTDPTNYLGNQYSDHIAAMYALALSEPKKFYTVRAHVTKTLKREIIKDFYAKVFSVLSTAKIGAFYVYGNVGITNAEALESYRCEYPNQKINELALSFASTIDSMMEEVVDIIMPDKINRVVDSKLAKVGDNSLP